MELVIDTGGTIRCVYSEMIDLAELGKLTIKRASHVEPDTSGGWWADMAPVHGPKLGPFKVRSEALDAELRWIRQADCLINGDLNAMLNPDMSPSCATPSSITANPSKARP